MKRYLTILELHSTAFKPKDGSARPFQMSSNLKHIRALIAVLLMGSRSRLVLSYVLWAATVAVVVQKKKKAYHQQTEKRQLQEILSSFWLGTCCSQSVADVYQDFSVRHADNHIASQV